MMTQIRWSTLILFFSLFLLFTGCGTNNSQDPLATAPVETPDDPNAIASLSIDDGNMIAITKDNQQVEINIRALNKSNVAVTSGQLFVQYPTSAGQNAVGTFAEASAAIQPNGIARFTYTGPSDIQSLVVAGNTTAVFTFFDVNNSLMSTSLTINFGSEKDDNSIAKLSVINGETVTVSGDAQPVSINIQALNKFNVPVTAGQLGIQYPADVTSANTGSFDKAFATIGENGVASFTYTSPTNIQSVIDSGYTESNFTFYDVNDSLMKTILTVKYNTTYETPAGTSVANIVISDPAIIISEKNEVVTLNIYAFDANGVGVESALLAVEYDSDALNNNLDVGTVPNEVAIVNGVGVLSYVGPSDLSAAGSIGPSTFKIYDKAAADVQATLQVSFVQTGSPIAALKLSTTSTVQLTQNSESVGIKVFALNYLGQPVAEGTLAVRYPTTTYDNGAFAMLTSAISDGIATFDYTGPDKLADNNANWSRTFSFYDLANNSIGTGITFSYVPSVTDALESAKLAAISPVTLTQNNEVVELTIRVFDSQNRPYNSGTVEVIYPDAAVTNQDVGSFSASSVEVSEGKAVFVYTGPKNLKSLVASGIAGTSFSFYHSTNPTEQQALSVTYAPATDVIVNTTYHLKFISGDGNNTTQIEAQKFFTLSLADADDVLVPDADITSIVVTSLNTQIGRLIEPDGTISDTATFSKNKLQIGVQTYRKSGLVPIHVKATFTDVNGNVQTIEKTFDVVVFSGPPTAMSISYAGTDDPDVAHAQFIENFSVKLTDKYNNPVNTNPMIQVGAIAGYVKSTSAGLYNNNLYVASAVGKIDSDVTSGARFTTTPNYDLANVSIYNDVLVTFGNGFTYDKSGKWDFDQANQGPVLGTTNTMLLDEQFDYTSATYEMGFAVGNNHRQDTCRFGEEWVVTTESSDGTYRVDSEGYATVKMPYDYYMVGKDIIFYVNLVGTVLGDTDKTIRVGEAKKHTLRGHGLTAIPVDGYKIPKGTADTVTFTFVLTDAEHVFYRNANPNFTVDLQGDGADWTASYKVSAIRPTADISDYRGCSNGGVVWVNVAVTAGPTADATVKLTSTVVSSEFLY